MISDRRSHPSVPILECVIVEVFLSPETSMYRRKRSYINIYVKAKALDQYIKIKYRVTIIKNKMETTIYIYTHIKEQHHEQYDVG